MGKHSVSLRRRIRFETWLGRFLFLRDSFSQGMGERKISNCFLHFADANELEIEANPDILMRIEEMIREFQVNFQCFDLSPVRHSIADYWACQESIFDTKVCCPKIQPLAAFLLRVSFMT
jgi:hypothetical protein